MSPEKEELVTAMSIQMRAEIRAYGPGLLRGLLHSRYLEAPYEFYSFVQMIEKMEEIFDSKRFPQAFLSPRSFGGEKQKAKTPSPNRGDDIFDAVKQLEEQEPAASQSTFDIGVKFRQNATWQGSIFWVEKNRSQDFRSVLEMLKLMDEALADGPESRVPVGWHD